jgi:hypothetical protein
MLGVIMQNNAKYEKGSASAPGVREKPQKKMRAVRVGNP